MISAYRFFSNSKPLDTLVFYILSVIALSVAALLFLIVVFLVVKSLPVINFSSFQAFFSHEGWHPLEQKFGILPMLWATLAVSFGALIVALPLGIGTAIFSLYFATKKMSHILNMMINLLAGIPSVIFGLWGLTKIVPLINQWHAPGTSVLAAIIVLAVMVLPTIAITSRAALMTLPISYSHASASLSFSRMSTILKVLIPAASSGIAAGVLLAFARALGETMAVLMVAGNVVQIPMSIFEPVRVLTANIALEMAYATDHHKAALFTSGLILMLLVGFSVFVAERLRRDH